jgi:hypothetical protein
MSSVDVRRMHVGCRGRVNTFKRAAEPARSRSRKKGDGKRSRWKVPRRRRGARGGCAAMRERVPNAEFDRLDRYRVRSGLDRTVDARDARTVEVDGGLDGEGAPAGGLGGDGRGALVEALAADGGRHAAGRGGGRDARHIRSWFVKRVLRCGVRRRVMATAARPFPFKLSYRANSAKRTIGHVIDIVSNGYCTVISHQTL